MVTAVMGFPVFAGSAIFRQCALFLVDGCRCQSEVVDIHPFLAWGVRRACQQRNM